MRLFIALLTVALLLGCVGEEPPPEPVKNESVGPSGPGPIQIIVEEQKNQTTLKNDTGQVPIEEEPVEDNTSAYTFEPEQLLAVYFIDVGGSGQHGDAVLIKKGDLDILVDAGAREKGARVVDFLRSHAVDDIEVLVSTSADPRRYGGMAAVADNYEIGEFWWADDSFGDPDYGGIVQRMSDEARDVKRVEDGFTAEFNGIYFEALNPPVPNRFDDINNDALVLRVDDRNFSLLLTSAIQTGAQGRLLNQKGAEINASVMQAPYYGVGVGTSGIGLFLLSAKPKDMIITGSSDDSAPNGGSREPFKRLMSQYGIAYHESYANGSIRITTDGENYTVSSLGAGQ